MKTKLPKILVTSFADDELSETSLATESHLATFATIFSLLDEATPQDLEELVIFLLDGLTMAGHAFTLTDSNMDQLIANLTSLIATMTTPLQGSKGSHLYLVLGEEFHQFPLESMPALRSRSVTRLPSASFLLDRLQLLKHGETHSTSAGPSCGLLHILDKKQVQYLVNPGNDLPQTEITFGDWCRSQDKHGWCGHVGTIPSEADVLKNLSEKDLFL